MIKQFAAVAIVATASLSFAAAARADDIPATPMNHGPLVVHGMGPIGEIANVGLMPANILAVPVINTTGAVVGATPMAVAAAEEPMARPMRHHRRHHMMSKKKMMTKKM